MLPKQSPIEKELEDITKKVKNNYVDENKLLQLKKMSISPYFPIMLIIHTMEWDMLFHIREKNINDIDIKQIMCLTDIDKPSLKIIHYYPYSNYQSPTYKSKMSEPFTLQMNTKLELQSFSIDGRIKKYVEKIHANNINFFYTKEGTDTNYVITIFNTTQKLYTRYIVKPINPFIETMNSLWNIRGITSNIWVEGTLTEKLEYVKQKSKLINISTTQNENKDLILSSIIIEEFNYTSQDILTTNIPDIYMRYKYDPNILI